MDPLGSIFLGMIANVGTSFLALACRGIGKIFTSDELHKRMEATKEALGPLLKAALDNVSETVGTNEPVRMEELCLFISSPETEQLVRQVFSTALTQAPSGENLAAIEREFSVSLALFVGSSAQEVAATGKALFVAAVKGCEVLLKTAIDEGVLSAHEAMSAARHRLIQDQLTGVSRVLSHLEGMNKPRLEDILTFEVKYRSQVGARHAFITPPNFDTAAKLPIDDLYVPPDFARTLDVRDQSPEPVTLPQFLGQVHRAVLLGNPGAGKSTLTAKLCHDLSLRYGERLLGGRSVTPIPVVLRDYGAAKKTADCSILQFIERTANSTYQLSPPVGALEHLLLSGRSLVIFDGLDELLETSYRQQISADVESFCNIYPTVSVLVTSRFVGYDQAPLDKSRFEVFSIAPFRDEQVEAYVVNWYSMEEELTAEGREKAVTAFLSESEVVSDLRSNPLMLALMCNLYRGEGYIPRNRPDVYEKCARMLFERWDKSRGIHVLLPIQERIEPALKYLANWIYSDETLRSGVTEVQLIEKATEYLYPNRFEDREEARAAASSFISFCRGRAWVMSDTGTTKEGERLYQFTHTTFLEYFAAAHLVRVNPTPESLLAILLPRIAKGEWDVVAQLALQIMSKQHEGACEKLLAGVLDAAYNASSSGATSLLDFAARSLQFLVPSPKCVRSVATACTDMVLTSFRRGEIVKGPYLPSVVSKAHPLGNVLKPAEENETSVTRAVADLLVTRIRNQTSRNSMDALDLWLGMESVRPMLGLESPRGVRSVPEMVVASVYESCREEALTLSRRNPTLAVGSWDEGWITLSDLMSWHGPSSLFRNYFMLRRWTVCPVQRILLPFHSEAVRWMKYPFISRKIGELDSLGDFFLRSKMPWIELEDTTSDLLEHITRYDPLDEQDSAHRFDSWLNGSQLFAGLILIGTSLEGLPQVPEETDRVAGIGSLVGCQGNSPLRVILETKFAGAASRLEERALDCGFTEGQKAFINDWVAGRFVLCRPMKRKGATPDL